MKYLYLVNLAIGIVGAGYCAYAIYRDAWLWAEGLGVVALANLVQGVWDFRRSRSDRETP